MFRNSCDMNMHDKDKERLLAPVFFGAIVIVFFGFLYPHHLTYQEQLQFFSFSGNYLCQEIFTLGGLAKYIGAFFTQFFYFPLLGAFLLAFLLVVLQQLVFRCSCELCEKANYYYPLTFLPSIFTLLLLLDENYLIAGVVSSLMLSLMVIIYQYLSIFRNKVVAAFGGVLVLFFTIGVNFIFYVLFVVVHQLVYVGKKRNNILYVVAILLFTAVMPVLGKNIFPQMSLDLIFSGNNYFRFPLYFDFRFLLPGFSIIALPLFMKYLPGKRTFSRGKRWYVAQYLLVFLVTFIFTYHYANFGKEEIMAYDYYAQKSNWNKIIDMANKKSPRSPVSVSLLNLALGKKDLLAEKMFCYYQNGVKGLFPGFRRDFNTPMMVNEIYYHLGLINTSQRFAFEAMEAIPNYTKSTRVVKRLAEISIINQQYILAEKYLKMLQKTLFHQKWANDAMTYLGDEEKINNHAVWGKLRELRIDKDFLYSGKEIDNMLGLLFQSCKNNRMAFEYLLGYYLLDKRIERFVEVFPMGEHFYDESIPKSYQEALIYVWGLFHRNITQNMPYPIDDEIIQRVRSYGEIYTTQKNSKAILFQEFSDTYWYYFHFRN